MDRGLSISQNRKIIDKLLSISFPIINENSMSDDIYEIYECIEQIKKDADKYSKYLKSIIENR